MVYYIEKEKDLVKISKIVKSMIKPGQIVILNGPLGAGKTTFVRYYAKEIGINAAITSPTFNLIKEYEKILCHVDAYRINQEDIGIDYYLENNYYIFVEWAENISDYLDNVVLQIDFEYTETGRKITINEVKC